MEGAAPDPLAELRLMAAKLALGLARSWEFPPAADRALALGACSPALAELATLREPLMSDVRPLFARALGESGLSSPSRVDAAWLLARHCVERIASETESPRAALGLLKEVSYSAADVLPDKEHVGDALDVAALIGTYWSYDEPNAKYYEPEQRLISDEQERQTLLALFARREAQAWLERHPQPWESSPERC